MPIPPITYEEASAPVQRAVRAAVHTFPAEISEERFKERGFYDPIADAITKALLAYADESEGREADACFLTACDPGEV